jgi:hypothetical protein
MTLSTITKHLTTAGEHVGDLLWWTLEDARVNRRRLEAVWADAGLSPNHLPEPPTAEKALKTAVRECQVGQADYLIRLGKEDTQEVVFAVVQERRDGAGNLTHQQEARIALYRSSPAALSTDAPEHELVKAVGSAYDKLLNTHTPDDVRRALLKTLSSCAAVTLREHGGVYWVPAPYTETLRRLQQAVSNIGRSRIDIIPIHATPEGQQALANAAGSAIRDDLQALTEEIEGFVKEPPRPSTLTRRLQAFDDLRQRAQLYHSILQVQVTDLDAKLTELTSHVQGLLNDQASQPT